MLMASLLGGGYLYARPAASEIRFDFFGNTVSLPLHPTVEVPFEAGLSEEAIRRFYSHLQAAHHESLVDSLLAIRSARQLDDWFYYQLIRRTAQQLAPKADNYYRYTLYKWFFLVQSGYDATLALYGDELLLSVYSQDPVYGIPYYHRGGRQYVCLNIHDYNNIEPEAGAVRAVDLDVPQARQPFSYKVSRLPELSADTYVEQQLHFSYGNRALTIPVKLNPQLRQVFANYPSLDFASYFNIPMSKATYQSLLPFLRRQVKHMTRQQGVDYLMQFTRNAFVYEEDQVMFGKEKRMGPEETLLYEKSDCDDRAALFYYLVKEIYNLPMVALMYPNHVAIGVDLGRPIGQTVTYNGRQYTICEPTPQGNTDLALGEVASAVAQSSCQVVYAYNPGR